MKKNNSLPEMAKKVTFGAAIVFVASSSILTGCKKDSAAEPATETVIGNSSKNSAEVKASGTNGGYYWGTYYTGSGSSTISFPSTRSIKGTWTSGTTDYGFGKGWKPGWVRTTQFRIDSYSNVHSVGLYGWTQSPLVEYYITVRGSHGGTSLGTMNSDGFTYNCYKQQRVNAPSIEGTKTFWQFKNSRQIAAGTGGTITVTMANHVNFWKSKGLTWGSSVYDLLVEQEAFSGPGSCQLTILN
jgi:endo-1,4-beta-xylanase